ncbi:MAG: response regulator [Verrucomicrobiota bacterium]
MNFTESIKFLLVDDLETNLQALSALLKRDGLDLYTARSGPEALELLLVHDFALALLDVQMPGMNGFELAEVMRSTERTRKVPIIFLTAGTVDSQYRIRGYDKGAVDFLAKPIEATILLNKATTFFELAHQRQELARMNSKLAEADRRKDEFLAMLAHELRNPLAPLRNSTEILLSGTASSSDREQAQSIVTRQIDNMARMIDDLLDVSRITEGKIELRKQAVTLESILTAATTLVSADCSKRQQGLHVSLPEEPVYLDADPTRLEQIFGNLLTNASKYAGEGCRIDLKAERSGSEVVVRVIDNGAGIDPELLPRIFDLFVQASRTLDRQHGGLGIGLTLVRRLVNLHGGSIKAHSEGLGKGTEFAVRLPVMASPPPTAAAPRKSLVASVPRRLLIVDDNVDSARSLSILQKHRGHETRTASCGSEALEIVTGFKPDAILLDIGLPGMDGFEIARQIRATPEVADVFLIAMTGYGSDRDQETAREAGFNKFLVKPIDLAQLQEWLRTLA